MRRERFVGDVASKLGIDHAGKTPGVAHVERDAGDIALAGLQIQTLQKELFRSGGKGCIGFQANRSQTCAFLQHALHVLAVVVIQIFFGAIVWIDVGVTRYADNACTLGGVHREHFVDDGLDGVFQKDVLSTFTGQLDYALCLMGQRNKAERSIFGANVLALLFSFALSCF